MSDDKKSMELSAKDKAHIDSLTYEGLLRHWRYAQAGDYWFQGARGDYWKARMQDRRAAEADPVGVSKRIGWDR